MIWTLTVNPSLDYNVQLENFAEGKVNRSSRETRVVFPAPVGPTTAARLPA